jgi:hypothetical protein
MSKKKVIMYSKEYLNFRVNICTVCGWLVKKSTLSLGIIALLVFLQKLVFCHLPTQVAPRPKGEKTRFFHQALAGGVGKKLVPKGFEGTGFM